jgi:hypothetical protein
MKWKKVKLSFFFGLTFLPQRISCNYNFLHCFQFRSAHKKFFGNFLKQQNVRNHSRYNFTGFFKNLSENLNAVELCVTCKHSFDWLFLIAHHDHAHVCYSKNSQTRINYK